MTKKQFKRIYSEYRYYLGELKTAVMYNRYNDITYNYEWYKMCAEKLIEIGLINEKE